MNAAVLYGREDVKIERVDIPRVADDEVLVRVEVALTCGTDLKVWKQGFHARMIKPPALFGHELAGVIEEQGRAVNGGVHKGMRVLPANSAPCKRLLLLPQGPAESLRRPSLQQRRVCRIHPHPWQNRSPEHAGNSRRSFVCGCGHGGAAGVRSCAAFTKPAFKRAIRPS